MIESLRAWLCAPLIAENVILEKRIAELTKRLESLEVQTNREYHDNGQEFSNLRAIIVAQSKDRKPAPSMARSFREVQSFLGDEDA